MDVTKILEDLRREHQQLEEAILSLERLAAGGKRRGRPPAWLAAAQQSNTAPAAPRGPGRPAGSKNKTKKKKAPSAEAPEAS
jgi:cell division septum initiation protein DivIVA